MAQLTLILAAMLEWHTGLFQKQLRKHVGSSPTSSTMKLMWKFRYKMLRENGLKFMLQDLLVDFTIWFLGASSAEFKYKSV